MKIKIYKIRCIVLEKKRGGRTEDAFRMDEKVILGHLDRAREVFRDYKNRAEGYFAYSKYFGMVELFEPHIFDNGELAYWPDNDKYIENFRKES